MLDNDDENDPATALSNRQPIALALNLYSFDHMVVTKKEIKMYNSENGVLRSIINSIFKVEGG